ncbi:nucleoporin Ndc1 [Drosophila guanche]|uniref:Blast:Nucleoporin Ndc1 n=1 Tax=Drosophila guanche TaxID=7266 RepID=A0A3B0JV45_DROGU|nr:nucleoporin Ndc1 [Drosophila guanche]SPP77579.1 blast:Nucleoporin Ndc1 [Drosophila guanche]
MFGIIGEYKCRPRWLPNYVEEIPEKIWILLLSRYYTATLLCVFFDFLLLFYSCSLSFLRGIPDGTLLAFIPLLIVVQPGVAAYGLLLCLIHNKQPISYRTRLQRMGQQMPLRLRLLGMILYVSILTSWLYSRFMNVFGDYWPSKFLLIHGCSCGIAYFLDEHGMHIRRFSLIGLDVGLHIWQSISESTFTSHKIRLVVVTTFVSGLIQSCYGTLVLDYDWGHGWSAGKMFWAWLLTTLVLSKLHMIKNLYEMVMQQQLPLILNHREENASYMERLWEPIILWVCRQKMCQVPEGMTELQLSFYMALDVECLFGFRLLAASEFYDAAYSQCNPLCPTIFSPTRLHTSWLNLRELIMGMVDEFLANMKNAMEDNQQIQKTPKEGLRDATRPSTTKSAQNMPKCTPFRDQLTKGNLKFPPSCQPIKRCPTCGRPSEPIEGIVLQLNEICQCPNMLQMLVSWCRGIWKCLSVLPATVHYFCDTNPMEKMNHVLRHAEHLDDVLRGLVRICIRSLKEDKCRLMEPDLGRFLEALLLVEQHLYAARNLQMARGGRLCGTHQKLIEGIGHCMFSMLQKFSHRLDLVVQDDVLLKKLKCRMGIPHTHL